MTLARLIIMTSAMISFVGFTLAFIAVFNPAAHVMVLSFILTGIVFGQMIWLVGLTEKIKELQNAKS